MIEKKKVRCLICMDEHEIDSTGWIQSCIGYMDYDEYLRKIFEKVGL